MKKKLLTFVLLFSVTIFSQNILQDLDSEEISDRLNALNYIEQENLTQYMPAIESRVLLQENLQYQFIFLKTLDKLGDSNLPNYAVQYIENAQSFTGEDYLEYQVEAIRLLFRWDNYDYANLVLDYIGRNNTRCDSKAEDLLSYIATEVPKYEQEAITELKRILFTSPDSTLRAYAIDYLEVSKALQSEDMLRVLSNDQSSDVRFRALSKLIQLDYPSLRDLAINRIASEGDPLIRTEYAEILLQKSGLPEDIHFLENYNQTETNQFVFRHISVSINSYIPPVVSMSTPASTMINTLISFTTDLYNYRWIATEIKYNSYMNDLDIISKYIQRNMNEDAINKINTMLNQVEFDFNQTPALAFEAYTFLHYHLLNIKNKLGQ